MLITLTICDKIDIIENFLSLRLSRLFQIGNETAFPGLNRVYVLV